MTAFLTELPEDEDFAWRIHVAFDEKRTLNGHKSGASPWYIYLTDTEVREVVRAYFDQQDAGENCPACGRDLLENQVPYNWEDECGASLDKD